MEWFISRDGKQEGPYSREQMGIIAQNGVMQPTDLLWHAGMEEWTPASKIPGLLMPPPRPTPESLPTNSAATPFPKPISKLPGKLWTKRALAFAAFLLAFVAVKAAKEWYYQQPPSNEKMTAYVEKAVADLKSDADKQFPGDPKSIAISKAAAASTSTRLSQEPDVGKKAEAAADMFWGFYWMNTRARPNYCQKEGVNIAAFVTAFQASHANEFALARQIYADRSKLSEERLYEVMRAQLDKALMQDMSDIAAMMKGSGRDACQFLAEHGSELISELKLQPDIRQALHDYKR